MMSAFRTALVTLAVTLAALSITACEDDNPAGQNPTEQTIFGSSVNLFNGTVRSFVRVDASGNPLDFGVRVSAQTVNNMPPTPGSHPAEHMYDVPIPAEFSKTAVQHISLDWNAFGHEPPGIYDTAHFDIHFYTVPKSERMTWSMQGADSALMVQRPDSTLVPGGYITDGSGVPFMGMHFVDIASPEFNGQPFSSTFIWGFHGGQQAFIEPMITQWYLKSRTPLDQALKLPVRYSRSGVYYPTRYSVRFDAATNEHVITLGTLVKR
jgi:hypothetical protein